MCFCHTNFSLTNEFFLHNLFPLSIPSQTGICLSFPQTSPPCSGKEGSVDRNISQQPDESHRKYQYYPQPCIDQILSHLSLPGHCKERRDCVQGCEATGHPHTHGDIWGVPEENSPHHRWLHPQLAPAWPDWSRGSGGGGIIFTGDRHDVQLWICWINIHCCLRCINPGVTAHRRVIYSCDI